MSCLESLACETRSTADFKDLRMEAADKTRYSRQFALGVQKEHLLMPNVNTSFLVVAYTHITSCTQQLLPGSCQ